MSQKDIISQKMSVFVNLLSVAATKYIVVLEFTYSRFYIIVSSSPWFTSSIAVKYQFLSYKTHQIARIMFPPIIEVNITMYCLFAITYSPGKSVKLSHLWADVSELLKTLVTHQENIWNVNCTVSLTNLVLKLLFDW